MTATVLTFKARTQPERKSDCSCRPGRLCYPHRLTNLADLLRAHEGRHDGELVIPAESLTAAVADALAVIDGITAECLPPTERTTAQ